MLSRATKFPARTPRIRRFAPLALGLGVVLGAATLTGAAAAPSRVEVSEAGSAMTLASSTKSAVTLQADEYDFSAAPLGPLTSSYLTKNWSTASIGDGLSRASVVDDNGTPRLRISLPKGAVGASSSGSTWRRTFPGTLEATSEYWVRFDPNFDWTKGGKLPGLQGGAKIDPGGGADPHSFSSRYMWNDGGKLTLYLYHSQMEGEYGDSYDLGTLKKGQGYVLKQRVKMNTPGVANGELEVWVDGVRKLIRTDMRWRPSGYSWNITSLYWSVFHGGNNAAYAPNRNNWIDFDRVRVTRRES